MVIWHISFTLKPGAVEEYLTHFTTLQEAIASVDGIESGEIYRQSADPDKLFCVMIFRDRAAADAYPPSPERKVFMDHVDHLYASVDRLTIYETSSVTDGLAGRG